MLVCRLIFPSESWSWRAALQPTSVLFFPRTQFYHHLKPMKWATPPAPKRQPWSVYSERGGTKGTRQWAMLTSWHLFYHQLFCIPVHVRSIGDNDAHELPSFSLQCQTSIIVSYFKKIFVHHMRCSKNIPSYLNESCCHRFLRYI